MTKEQVERLQKYEQELNWALHQNFMSMTNSKFNEIMSVYNEIYETPLSRSQMNCSTCRLNAVKRLAKDYFNTKADIGNEELQTPENE